MRRTPVPELEDFPWWPAPLRDAMTRFLRTASELLGVSGVAVPVIREALASTATTQIVDLCSGGGGPILAVSRALQQAQVDVDVVLTDKYPNLAAFTDIERALPGLCRGERKSVDATAVPASLAGVRTMFNALHHLPETAARAVFADAVAGRQPIACFEIVERSAQGLAMIATLPLTVAALTPFSRPDLQTLLLTYALPIVPAATTWDGLASCLRAYSIAELEALVAPLRSPTYRFRVARVRVPTRPVFVTYVLGLPVPG